MRFTSAIRLALVIIAICGIGIATGFLQPLDLITRACYDRVSADHRHVVLLRRYYVSLRWGSNDVCASTGDGVISLRTWYGRELERQTTDDLNNVKVAWDDAYDIVRVEFSDNGYESATWLVSHNRSLPMPPDYLEKRRSALMEEGNEE